MVNKLIKDTKKEIEAMTFQVTKYENHEDENEKLSFKYDNFGSWMSNNI